MASTDELWGTTLTDVRLDLPAGRVELDVTRPHQHEDAELYRVTLTGVTRFALTNAIPVPWNYSELTAWYEETNGHGTIVSIELWSAPTGIEIACQSYSIERR